MAKKNSGSLTAAGANKPFLQSVNPSVPDLGPALFEQMPDRSLEGVLAQSELPADDLGRYPVIERQDTLIFSDHFHNQFRVLLHLDIFFPGLKRFQLILENLDLKAKISDQYVLIKHPKTPLRLKDELF